MIEAQEKYIEQSTKIAVIVISILLTISVLIALFRSVPFQYFVVALTCIVAIPFFLSVEKIICLLTFYVIAFEIPLFKGSLYPLSVNYFVIDLALLLLFLFLLGDYSFKKNESDFSPFFSWPFLLFFLIVGLSFFMGIRYGNNLHYLRSELRILGYYAVYFVAVRHFQEERWIKIFSITIVIATLLVTFDYLYTYNSLPIFRFVSRQVHIFLLVTPFLVSLMILDKNTLRRIVYFILLIPISLSVIISQTRGTWFSIFIAILLAAFLSLFASFKGQRKILSFSFAILTLLIIVIFSLNLIGRMSKTKEEFVQTRVESISNLQADYSLAMRAHSYLTVLKKIQSHPWLGNGLGATATYLFFGQYSTQNNVDSTYLTILWKMGIAGLLVFLFLYFLLLKKAFFIYRKEQDLFLRAFAVGMLSAFAAFLILGTISPILISSRFNFLFGVLFAITEILAQKTFKQRVLEKA